MLLAVRHRLAARKIERRSYRAIGMRATSVYVDHAILSMLLELRRRFAALYAERWSFRAGGMGTTSVANVDHVIRCMLLAIAAFLLLRTLWVARIVQKAFEHAMFAPDLGCKMPGRGSGSGERVINTPDTA